MSPERPALADRAERAAEGPPRRPTIEWQVCGICNYDCSYCIQSREYRVGHPSDEQIELFLRFFEGLRGRWEIKMTGGEPFAFKGFLQRIVPGLIERTSHTVSVLTNLSAPESLLDRFAQLTYGRLGIVSASLHLEFTDAETFVHKAARLRERIAPEARMVVNSVLVPGRLGPVVDAEQSVRAAGLRLFPQLMKINGGVTEYSPEDSALVHQLVGDSPSPRRANLAPSYKGRRCYAGAEYLVLLQNGDAYSCRTARRHKQGLLGNVFAGTVRLWESASPCPYDICPCTVPANRGMIEGVSGSAAEDAEEEAQRAASPRRSLPVISGATGGP